MSDALPRLNDYGTELVATLREAIQRKPVTRFGPVNASGNLAASLHFTTSVTPTGYRLELYGAGYALTLEYGRRPGAFPPLKSIQAWIEAKGIVPAPDANGRTPGTEPGAKGYSQLAYLIGRKIANSGTVLFRQGAPSGLFGEQLAGEVPARRLAQLLLPVFVVDVQAVLHEFASFGAA